MGYIILLFLGHNFRTCNPSKSSKVSKCLDFSLVSKKNLSKILQSSGLGPVPDEVGQKDLKLLHLWHHSHKSEIQNQKFFFIANLKTRRVFWGFEQLSSTITWWVMQLPRHVQAAWFSL